jgi:putative endonuclease
VDYSEYGVLVNTRDVGFFGEKVARDYLLTVGLKAVSNNFRSRYGEIDIVCEDDRNRVFVEVKSRRSGAGSRLSSVDRSKQKKIIKTMLEYQESNFSEKQPRFDVVEVVFDSHGVQTVHHISNAF